jgi:hypothetical protein
MNRDGVDSSAVRTYHVGTKTTAGRRWYAPGPDTEAKLHAN